MRQEAKLMGPEPVRLPLKRLVWKCSLTLLEMRQMLTDLLLMLRGREEQPVREPPRRRDAWPVAYFFDFR